MSDFTFFTDSEVRLKMQDVQTWVIPNLIADTTTLIYGESEAGKSFIVSALVASLMTGKPFLDHEAPTDRVWRPLIATTDDRGDIEYHERIHSVLPTGMTPDIRYTQLPVMRSAAMWADFVMHCESADVNFVVIDNLSQAADGDLNKPEPVKDFFEGIRMLVARNIPVVIVGHSTEKASATGHKSENPMFSSAIKQSVRWRCFVKRRGQSVTLKFAGNIAKGHEMTVRHGDGALFDVKDTRSAGDDEADQQVRDADRQNKFREMAQWIVENGQKRSVKAFKEELGKAFGENPGSIAKYTGANGPIGRQLIKTGSQRSPSWALANRV